MSAIFNRIKMNDVNIREISKTDNVVLAEIIRSVLMEYDAHHGGTAFDDPELDHMFEVDQNEGSIYFALGTKTLVDSNVYEGFIF
jgi:putative acetyltransferase